MTRNLELRLRPVDLSGGYHLASVTSYGEVSCAGYALPEYEGVELGTVGIIRDVTLRKEHELSLEAAVASKELLLKEVHHRVKNNLQVVSSLLNLQETTITDEEARKVFLECQTQIQTMSMVHEVLYRSSSFAGVAMASYFERLVDYLSSVYEAGFRGIVCGIAAEGITLDLDDAIPIALIVNELVSNCMKHAFPGGRSGKISVSLREEAERWILEVEDDGVGLGGTSCGHGSGHRDRASPRACSPSARHGIPLPWQERRWHTRLDFLPEIGLGAFGPPRALNRAMPTRRRPGRFSRSRRPASRRARR